MLYLSNQFEAKTTSTTLTINPRTRLIGSPEPSQTLTLPHGVDEAHVSGVVDSLMRLAFVKSIAVTTTQTVIRKPNEEN